MRVRHLLLSSMLSAATAVLLASTLVGCADQMLSDARIRDSLATPLGQSPSAIRISDRTSDGLTNTFVVARTPRGSYRCTINGGGVLAMGIVNPPSCSPL